MPNFGLIGLFISSWQPKQLPVGVAIATPHPNVVNNAYLGTLRPHAKFQPDRSLD